MRMDDSADMRMDAVLENCIFYIFPMYEFLHSLVQERRFEQVETASWNVIQAPKHEGSNHALRTASSRTAYAACCTTSPLKVMPFLSAEMATCSPSLTLPDRISSASGSCTAFWIARLSGRAP
jgi:hypothetical protein